MWLGQELGEVGSHAEFNGAGFEAQVVSEVKDGHGPDVAAQQDGCVVVGDGGPDGGAGGDGAGAHVDREALCAQVHGGWHGLVVDAAAVDHRDSHVLGLECGAAEHVEDACGVVTEAQHRRVADAVVEHG